MKRLSLDDYPYIDIADAGKLPNIGYGHVENVRAHLIDGGATALLLAGMTASDTLLTVEDASRFPEVPFTIQAASERMLVTAKDGNAFTVTRGYDNTTASAHGEGRTIFEVKAEYVYLLSPEPVKAIDSVYVDGIVQTQYAAYAGLAGDEHPDWPGKAVIAFSVSPEIKKQRNIETGFKTSEEDALIIASSHTDIAEGTAGVGMGVKTNQCVWAVFEGAEGAIAGKYISSVKNTGALDTPLKAVLINVNTGEVIRQESVLIPAGATKTVTLMDDGGDAPVEFSLRPHGYSGSFVVYYMKKTVTKTLPLEEEECAIYTPPCLCSSYTGEGIEKTPVLKPKGKTVAWAAYIGTELGTIERQMHYAKLKNTGTSKAKIMLSAVESSGQAIMNKSLSIAAGEDVTISLVHMGGGWDAATKLVIISGEARLERLYKEISYLPTGGEVEKPLTTASARVVIGDKVSADAEWAVDEDGNYGGIGSLIERPDFVIKHFLVTRMGFSHDEIDGASFDSAGSSYSSAISGGYKFGFIIGDIAPSEILEKLAFECRSRVAYEGGKWRLYYLPDVAPSPVKTVSKDGLAGNFSQFRFTKSLDDMANEIEVRFKRDYSGAGWKGIIRAEDAASMAKYGVYKKLLKFETIRDKDTAQHVLNHMLLRSKAPVLRVEFPVFYEHWDLKVGDTVEIENTLYGGKVFLIEKIRRADKFRATVKGREWWG